MQSYVLCHNVPCVTTFYISLQDVARSCKQCGFLSNSIIKIPAQKHGMATERKSTSFKQKWWDNVAEYLNNHPEEGFDSNQVKQFIKNVLNRYMADSTGLYTKEEILMLKEMNKSED